MKLDLRLETTVPKLSLDEARRSEAVSGWTNVVKASKALKAGFGGDFPHHSPMLGSSFKILTRTHTHTHTHSHTHVVKVSKIHKYSKNV